MVIINAFYFSLTIWVKKKLTCNFLQKKKIEVLCAFKKFKALVEMESGHNIKAMRSNREEEFI